jgi:heme exporter protein C
MRPSRDWLPLLWLATFVAVLGALALVFLWVPPEATMGNIQRIFYFHVASAWNAFAAFAIVIVTGIGYLRTRARRWDRLAYAAAEVGMIFTTIVLITGPIWARPIWNAWWTWDPRLTTTLIPWFLYAGYLFIRSAAGNSEKEARLAAAFGVISFLDVPIVFFSARWWRSIHPTVIELGQINMEGSMVVTMLGVDRRLHAAAGLLYHPALTKSLYFHRFHTISLYHRKQGGYQFERGAPCHANG